MGLATQLLKRIPFWGIRGMALGKAGKKKCHEGSKNKKCLLGENSETSHSPIAGENTKASQREGGTQKGRTCHGTLIRNLQFIRTRCVPVRAIGGSHGEVNLTQRGILL